MTIASAVPAAISDKPTAHCFTCRDRRTYTRLLASKPVYKCDGCGATREIEELGRVEIPGRVSPVPAPRRAPEPSSLPEFVAPKRRQYTNRRKDTTMKKSPLIEAIEKIVTDKTAGVGVTEARVREIVQEELLGALTGGAAKAAVGTCPRAPHKGKHGKKCREAGYQG